MSIFYGNGQFYFDEFGQTLTPTTDSRTVTLIADLLPLFKSHSRIDFASDDALCELYLSAAMSRVEQWTMMPILPKAYSWDVSDSNKNYTDYVLPLRNTVMAGEQFGFEPLIAAKLIAAPASWPVVLEVGFAAGADMPSDITLGIFELALTLYQQRSNSEMLDAYAEAIMNGNFQRYWVPRV